MIGNGSFFVFSNLPAYIAGHGDLILGTDKLCVTMKL
jgi:hypothetical protein